MSNLGSERLPATGLVVSQCVFAGNLAGTNGGAIYAVGLVLSVNQSLFTQNTAGRGNSLFADVASAGGAIWYSSQGFQGNISDSQFIGAVGTCWLIGLLVGLLFGLRVGLIRNQLAGLLAVLSRAH